MQMIAHKFPVVRSVTAGREFAMAVVRFLAAIRVLLHPGN